MYVHDTSTRAGVVENGQDKQCGKGPSACQTTLYSQVGMNLALGRGVLARKKYCPPVDQPGLGIDGNACRVGDGARGMKSWEDLEGSSSVWGPWLTMRACIRLPPLAGPHNLAKDETVAQSELAVHGHLYGSVHLTLVAQPPGTQPTPRAPVLACKRAREKGESRLFLSCRSRCWGLLACVGPGSCGGGGGEGSDGDPAQETSGLKLSFPGLCLGRAGE